MGLMKSFKYMNLFRRDTRFPGFFSVSRGVLGQKPVFSERDTHFCEKFSVSPIRRGELRAA